MSRREHWEQVYRDKSPDAVSWYRPQLERSVAWITRSTLDPAAHVVDVGGGASTLVDDLLDRGFERVTVADLSAAALAHTRARLGDAAERVRLVDGDVTTPLFDADSVDLWHDRAVFHFLTEPAQREAYVSGLRRALRLGGHVILATFGPSGPERCSGLPVVRYAPDQLAAVPGPGFTVVETAEEEHTTPWGAPQAFSWVLCRRDLPDEPPPTPR